VDHDAHTDSHSDTNGYRYGDSDAHGYTYGHSDLEPDGDPDDNGYPDDNGNAEPYISLSAASPKELSISSGPSSRWLSVVKFKATGGPPWWPFVERRASCPIP
jgi:hypothetical protein